MNTIAKVAVGAGIAFVAYRILRKQPVLSQADAAQAASQVAQVVNTAAQQIGTVAEAIADVAQKGVAQVLATAPADAAALPAPPMTQAEVQALGLANAAEASNAAANAANAPAASPAAQETVSPPAASVSPLMLPSSQPVLAPAMLAVADKSVAVLAPAAPAMLAVADKSVAVLAPAAPAMSTVAAQSAAVLAPAAPAGSASATLNTGTAFSPSAMIAVTAVDGTTTLTRVGAGDINAAALKGRLSGPLTKAVAGADPYLSAPAFEKLSESAKSVLLRGFAADYVAPKGIDEPAYSAAVRASTVSGLPIAWTQMLIARGVPVKNIEQVAQSLVGNFEFALKAEPRTGGKLDLIGLRQKMLDKFAPLPPGASMGAQAA